MATKEEIAKREDRWKGRLAKEQANSLELQQEVKALRKEKKAFSFQKTLGDAGATLAGSAVVGIQRGALGRERSKKAELVIGAAGMVAGVTTKSPRVVLGAAGYLGPSAAEFFEAKTATVADKVKAEADKVREERRGKAKGDEAAARKPAAEKEAAAGRSRAKKAL